VIEVSTIGVAAAHEAGFGAVIGVDHTGGSRALGENGADTVIADLSQLRPRKTTAA
jgi:beta-phosphoglucomutase-like phosphatase (HAD superfamily)